MGRELLRLLLITGMVALPAVATAACATNSNARQILTGAMSPVTLTETALDPILAMSEQEQVAALVKATYQEPLNFLPTGQSFVTVGGVPFGYDGRGEPTPLKPLRPVEKIGFQKKIVQETIPVAKNIVIAAYCVPEMAEQIRIDIGQPSIKTAIADYLRHTSRYCKSNTY